MGFQQLEPSVPSGASVPRRSTPDARIKSNSIISTDFETAIRKAGFGKFNYFMLLIAIPASCTSAFVTGTMSYVVPVAGADLGLTATGKALLQSAPYAGMICSAFIWGVLSDSFGRQRLMAIGFLLDFAMNTACALIPYLPSILIFKFLSGFMVCGPYSIFMAYISEVFMDKRRDIAVLSSGIFSSILQCLHVGLALLLIPAEPPSWIPLKSWQLFILACGFPALLTGVASVFCVESPKFLADQGKSEKALDICKHIYIINTGNSAESYPVKKIRGSQDSLPGEKKVSLLTKVVNAAECLKPPYVYRLLKVFGIQLFIASTLNLIRLWMPDLLTVMANAEFNMVNETTICPLLVAGVKAQSSSQVLSREDIYYKMMVLNVGCLIAHILFITVVKKLGKKVVIMSVATIAGFCAVSIPNIDSSYVFIPASVLVSVLNTAFYAQISLVVEIFPTSIRATSVSLTMMIGRIGVLTANFLFANLIYSYCQYIYYSLAISCLSIVCICAFLDTTPFAVPTVEPSKDHT